MGSKKENLFGRPFEIKRKCMYLFEFPDYLISIIIKGKIGISLLPCSWSDCLSLKLSRYLARFIILILEHHLLEKDANRKKVEP